MSRQRTARYYWSDKSGRCTDIVTEMGGVQGNLQTVRYTWECGSASTQVVGSKISLITVGAVWNTILFTEILNTAKPGVCA